MNLFCRFAGSSKWLCLSAVLALSSAGLADDVKVASSKPVAPVRTEPEPEVRPFGQPLSAKSFLNQPAPAIHVQEWIGAKPKLEGRFVYLDFWATWCGPCKDAIPHLNALHREFGPQVDFVALSEESVSAVRRMKSPVIEFHSAVDGSKRLLRKMEVAGLPHSVLIDPKGVVRWEGHPFSFDEATLRRLLEKYGPP